MGCNKILCSDNLVPDIAEQRIFFGEYSGFQRYDQPKYPFAVNLEEKARNAFWNPKEISLVSDRIKFEDLPQFIQEIEIEILLYQTLMDSGNNRGIDNILSTIVTSPEFEALYKTHAYFELIHSLSYSHILREVFPDATSVFNSLKDRKAIQKRIDKEIEAFNAVAKITNIDHINKIRQTIKSKVQSYIDDRDLTPNSIALAWDIFSIADDVMKLEFNADITDEEKRKLVLELIIRIYALESLKFYISFLVTYVINNAYHNRIQGIARIIKLINFDEDIHVAIMAGTLGILKKEPSEGFKELMESEWYTNKVTEIFTEVVNDELEWGDHLLSYGNIPTLTRPVMENFIQYYAHERSKKIANVSLYPGAKKSDVVSWFESYKDINKDNTAQQEAEATNYNIGILQDDLPEGPMSMDQVLDIFMGKYNGKKE